MEPILGSMHALYEAILEVISQSIILVFNCVDWFFTEHLLLSNIFSAGLLLGLADITIQTLEIYLLKSRDAYERERNYRSMQVGTVLGVFNHAWYAFLEQFLQGSGLSVVFKKIALDQAVAGPFFSSAFLVGMGLLEGRSGNSVYREWRQKFIHIYMVDWMFWPLAQFINFYLVPYRFRVFYVNFATFLWNTFLCYAKHVSGEEVRKRKHRVSGSSRTARRAPSISPSLSSRSRGTKNKSKAIKASRRSSRHSSLGSKRPHSTHQRKQLALTSADVHGDTKKATNNTFTSIRAILPYLNRAALVNLYDSERKSDSDTSETDVSCSSSSTSCRSNNSSIFSTNNFRSMKTNPHNKIAGTKTTIANYTKRSLKAPSDHAATKSDLPKNSSAANKPPLSMKMTNPKDQTDLMKPIKTKMQPGAPFHNKRSRNKTAIQSQLSKKASGQETGEVTRKLWPSKIVGKTSVSYRTPPSLQCAATAQVADFSTAVADLKDLTISNQSELNAALTKLQSDFQVLHELCAATYTEVDDGTRKLSTKADQLASWVALERKLNVEDIKAAVAEVLRNKVN